LARELDEEEINRILENSRKHQERLMGDELWRGWWSWSCNSLQFALVVVSTGETVAALHIKTHHLKIMRQSKIVTKRSMTQPRWSYNASATTAAGLEITRENHQNSAYYFTHIHFLLLRSPYFLNWGW
jgi:hypothetical protein